MKITKSENVKIGHWYTICCHLDLYQIEDDDDLKYVVYEMKNETDWTTYVWETKKDALLEIRSWWKDKDVLQEIDDLLAELENECQ